MIDSANCHLWKRATCQVGFIGNLIFYVILKVVGNAIVHCVYRLISYRQSYGLLTENGSENSWSRLFICR
jgi:hypothetical protein